MLSTHMPVPKRRIKSLIMKKLATKKHNNHNKDVNNDMIHMTVIFPLISVESVVVAIAFSDDDDDDEEFFEAE